MLLGFPLIVAGVHLGAEEEIELKKSGQVQEEAVGYQADVILATKLKSGTPGSTKTGATDHCFVYAYLIVIFVGHNNLKIGKII